MIQVMGKYGKDILLAFFLVFSWWQTAAPLSAQSESFPLISQLNARDDGFKQFIADVEQNRRRVFRNNNGDNLAAFLTVYQYIPREGEDLFAVSARCNIPYSALASLNRINHPSLITAGSRLLLPSVPGIFVLQEPQSDLEQLLASSRFVSEEDPALQINGTAFYFFPGSEFGAAERAFFLNMGFRFPLKSFRLTSAYGMRQNPVTGNIRLHQGLDLAAPAGTEVYSAGDGIITEVGEDAVYGNYIIIKHNASWASLYGHLQKTAVSVQNTVKAGALIGWVGSTGQSTGPHLHFELRQNGTAQNPDKYLFRPGGR